MMPLNNIGSVGDKKGYVVLAPVGIFAEKLKSILYKIFNDLLVDRWPQASHFVNDSQESN